MLDCLGWTVMVEKAFNPLFGNFMNIGYIKYNYLKPILNVLELQTFAKSDSQPKTFLFLELAAETEIV